MVYTVFGFRSGFLEAVRLRNESFERKAALAPLPLCERTMRGYAVGADGFFFLERRFGKGFQNFALLDEIAIEACQEFSIPLGELVGKIELNEMGRLAIPLFSWTYWTETSQESCQQGRPLVQSL
jgi:hypothetical protein